MLFLRKKKVMQSARMTDERKLRKAGIQDLNRIWTIIQQAILKRKEEGSTQWQDGYPNPSLIANDISNGYGYICLDQDDRILAYVALIFAIEPAYEEIEGNWLSEHPYACIHRLAVNQEPYTKGVATWIMHAVEPICVDSGYYSIRVDTNFDNVGMLRVFEKLGYQYCGEVFFRGAARKAYEKVLRA